MNAFRQRFSSVYFRNFPSADSSHRSNITQRIVRLVPEYGLGGIRKKRPSRRAILTLLAVWTRGKFPPSERTSMTAMLPRIPILRNGER